MKNQSMLMKTAFRCTIMRGGTSKGIFLMDSDLPKAPILRDRIILAIFGSPDIRQIDGLGGADSLTSKLAIISPSREPDHDVNYTFGAVGIDRPFIDYSANCGNISSAVGPFAIERKLIRPEEPFTTVKIFNTNTRKMIHARVPVENGKVVYEGDYEIAGVPNPGAKIELSFIEPGGAATGRLIPTGSPIDEVKIDTGERFNVTIIDAGNITAFMRAGDLGLKGTELPEEFDQDILLRGKLEAIRKKVGELIGIPAQPSLPKISFVASPQDFKTMAGKGIGGKEVDLVARVMAMGKMHKALAVTVGIPAAIAALVPDSVVQGIIPKREDETQRRKVIIGHPSGKLEVEVESRQREGQIHILRCIVNRTARKIMEGRVFISKDVYSSV